MTPSKRLVAGLQSSLLALAGTLGLTVATGTAPAAAATAAPHVMVIVMENAAYNQALGSPYVVNNPDAKYINGTLLSTYTPATSWYSVEHTSLYDYRDLISGADQIGRSRPFTATTLVDQLAAQKVSWKAYMESMPSPCYTGNGTSLYDATHNPFVQFKSIVNNPSQCQNVVPYAQSQMTADLNAPSPPSFVWISPNKCNDMHTKCSPTNNLVKQGDAWLSGTIPAVQSTQWYNSGGIIIVTWDESVATDTSGVPGTSDNGGHVATVVISAGNHSPYSAAGDHFGTLRGLQNAYGVGCLAGSCQAGHGDISGAFPAAAPGAITGTVTDATTTSAISGATVTCAACPTSSATTSGSGGYAFSSVPPGSYSLSFSAPGYQTQSYVPVTVAAGQQVTQDQTLTPVHQAIFSDGFESGSLSGWTSSSGLTTETTAVHSGVYAVGATVSSSAGDARKTLPATYASGYERVWFDMISHSTQVYVLQANAAANAIVAAVYVSSQGLLGLRAADATRHDSTTAVVANTWHELELGFSINGAASSVDLWLDGVDVLSLTNLNLNTAPAAVMQIGDAASHSWSAYFDDAAFDTQFLS